MLRLSLRPSARRWGVSKLATQEPPWGKAISSLAMRIGTDNGIDLGPSHGNADSLIHTARYTAKCDGPFFYVSVCQQI